MSFHTYHQIENLCRGCLVPDRKMVNVALYEAEFKDLTGITISPSDGLPQWVCYECVALLKKCVGFGNKVMKSHYKLCQYVLDNVPFVSDKESRPQLSQSETECYDLPGIETEQKQRPIIKTGGNNMNLPLITKVEGMQVIKETESYRLPIITNVESIKVTTQAEVSHCEDNVTEDACRKEKCQLDVASKSPIRDVDKLENQNNHLVKSNYSKRNIKKKAEEDRQIAVDAPVKSKIEKHKDENSDDVTIEVWCFSIDENGELTMKSQTRQPKHEKIMKLEEGSFEYMSTGTKAAIQATEKARVMNAGGHTSQQSDEVVKKRERKGKRINSTYTDSSNDVNAYLAKKIFPCDFCIKCFNNKRNLILHYRTHTDDNEENLNIYDNDSLNPDTHKNARYKCDKCKKHFSKKTQLKTHIRKHSENKPFKCDVCTEGFTESNSLTLHKRIHTGMRPFKCDICLKDFTRKVYLKCHYRIHKKTYKCNECKKQFASQKAFDAHKHATVKPYKCDICLRSFKYKPNFTIHYRSHTYDKSYTCDICMQGFARASDLKIHYRLHFQSKPVKTIDRSRSKQYTCQICMSVFKDLFSFDVHFSQHNTEDSKELSKGYGLNKQKGKPIVDKPFQCKTCMQRFRYNHTLISHGRFCAQIHGTKSIK